MTAHPGNESNAAKKIIFENFIRSSLENFESEP